MSLIIDINVIFDHSEIIWFKIISTLPLRLVPRCIAIDYPRTEEYDIQFSSDGMSNTICLALLGDKITGIKQNVGSERQTKHAGCFWPINPMGYSNDTSIIRW